MNKIRLWADCVLAALLPLYFLDDSLIPKTSYLVLMMTVIAIRFGVQNYNTRRLDTGIFFAAILFVLTYCMAAAYSTYNSALVINMVYPIIFFVILLSEPIPSLLPERTFVASAFVIVIIGWLRYVTGDGGLPSEHALGYWGIKYDIATRNSDVLLPLIVACAAIGAQALDARSDPLSLKIGKGLSLPIIRLAIRCTVILVALAAVLLSQSRGTWLAAILMIVLMFGKDLRALSRFAQLGVLLLLGGTAMLALFPEMFEKFVNVDNLVDRFSTIYTGGGGSSNGARWHLIQYAVELTARNPFFGVGVDRFNCCALSYGYTDILTTRHPENLYLHLAAGCGIIPAVMVTYILFKAAWMGLKSKIGSLHVLGGTLFSVLLYLQFNSEVPSLALWVILGLIAARTARREVRPL